ncbi:3'-5' exoribonuclease [Chromobacterium alkanivorans]|uniref:3'-5' exonuclease n=1 Tax=Chromobacterium alkanivorans TaxID=1071719 RepID=UPI001967343F|nr:3'-5' exonuclease [Chromobacterium alkanivorans]MBN3004486.1 3'-5' exoribonuclease [Chromobacterium alkanivorans]
MTNRYIITDLETMALTPDAIILSVGAVVADIEHGKAHIRARWYRRVEYLEQLPTRHADRSTWKWWQEQNDAARHEAFSYKLDRLPLWLALQSLDAWLRLNPYPIWGNGAPFDNTILSHAYLQHGMHWPFWRDCCLRNLKNMAPLWGGSTRYPARPEHLRKHIAIDDAEYEAGHLAELLHGLQTRNHPAEVTI